MVMAPPMGQAVQCLARIPLEVDNINTYMSNANNLVFLL